MADGGVAGSHEPPLHKCTMTIHVDASVEPEAFHAPSLRFRFLDGTKKQTPIIGSAGWGPLDHDRFRWEHVAELQVTEALLRQMDEDPVVTFVLGDQASASVNGAAKPKTSARDAETTSPRDVAASARPMSPATAAPAVAGPATSSTTTTTTTTTSGRGRLIADLFDLDLSGLFAPDVLSVEQTWRGRDAPPSPPSSASTTSLFDRLTRPKSPPAADAQSCFVAASGIRHLRIHVAVDQPLLSPSLRRALNPLTLTIDTIRRLPGAGTTTSDPHAMLSAQCRPVYATMRLFPTRRLYHPPPEPVATHHHQQQPHITRQQHPPPPQQQPPLTTVNRIVITSGRAHDAVVSWKQTTTIFCGRCDPAELQDALRASALTIEIHDRDLFQPQLVARLQQRWESLHATGIDPMAKAPPPPPSSASHEPKSPPSGGASSTSTTPRTTPLAAPPKPLDVFVVDEIARRDWRGLLLRSGETFAYGVASYRLHELLEKHVPPQHTTSATVETRPFASLKLTADVIAMKRRARPIGATAPASPDDDANHLLVIEETETSVVDLSPNDRLVREPGAFVAAGTTLSLLAVLHAPLLPRSIVVSSSSSSAASGAGALYSRMVLIFPYKDTRILTQIMRALERLNLTALPGVPIRSYQMTPSDKAACARGELDIVTGTMILDTDFRMVILEGLADGAMRHMHAALPRAQANDPGGYRMFANPELRFTDRLYAAFEIDLKRIKLRYALPELMNMPEIYMRTKVAEPCYLALTRLAELRRADRLAEVKDLELCPTAAMLLEVESKYGESISLEDIYGKTGTSLASGSQRSRPRVEVEATGDVENLDEDPASHDPEASRPEGEETPTTRTYTRYKAPTDATNPEFEAFRRTRQPKNYLDQRRQLSDAQQQEYERHKQAREAELRASGPLPPVFMYSGQRLRTQDALQEELRKRLAKDQHATFTYGPEFQSLAMSLVNPDELRQNEERESRRRWTTQRGFVYPAPRQTAEYYKHPDAPSEARCEDLRQPFVDNANHPKPVSRENNRGGAGERSEFSTLPSKDMVFGGTNGDGTVNADYFKSVHLCGEGLRKEMDEALRKEQEDWERKLVVDRKQIKFLAHGNICSVPRAHPSQLDRLGDILHGPTRSKPLRIVKNATLPSGKRVPLLPPPASIHNQQEYVGSVATTFATSLRPSDAATFLAADATTGRTRDYLFPATTDLLTPQVKKHTTHRDIRPLRSHERRGLLWSNTLGDS